MRLATGSLAATVLWSALCGTAAAQDTPASPDTRTSSDTEPTKPAKPAGKIVVEKWRFGYTLTAKGTAYRNIQLTKTIPMDWPEQRVSVVEEDFSPGVTVRYRNVEGVARQMAIQIPSLAADRPTRAVVTLEIKRFLPDPPADTAGFTIPSGAKSDRKLADYLKPSPMIESDRIEIRNAAAEVADKESGAWRKVEAIYDWVRKKIRYEYSDEVKGAYAGMVDGVGDCDEMTCLFIAMCRSQGIPARTVRLPGHCYPEFYLVDAQGKGRWFPCQAAGTRAFGSMFDSRPILQKGDNVSAVDVHSKKPTKFRFLPETQIATPLGSQQGALDLKMVSEKVKDGQ
jgi:transglutaminase-like putative cysteine protease